MPIMSRRSFLKTSGVCTAGAIAATYLPDQFLLWAGEKGLAKSEKITTYCEMCFWKCGVIATVVGGRVVKLEGNPLSATARGKLCGRGNGGIGLLYDPDRLKHPLIRTGKRGEGQFRKASWDEALTHIADKLKKIKEEHGPESLALFTHGSPTEHFMPLLQGFGSQNFAMPSFAQCRGPRVVGYELTYGDDIGSPERLDMANSKVVVLIGSHLGENMHNSQVQDFTDAIGNGARIIVVDPRFSVAAGKAHHWLPIKPASDMALILAWINIIIREGWYDREYVAKYTNGFDKLAAAVQQYTPEWAEKETDIPAARIIATAREMGLHRPAVCIHPGRHVTWDGKDVQRSRAIAILGAILGTWGREGGAYLATRASFPAVPPPSFPASNRPTLKKGGFPLGGAEGVTNAIREATSIGEPYPIKAWMVTGTNLMAAMPGQKETIEAINKLDLLVVVDVIPSDTSLYADVVLPECTYLERHDGLLIGKGRSLSASIRQPAVAPMYDSKPAWWIAKELSKKLGLEDYFPWEHYEDRLNELCLTFNIDYDELKQKGVITIPDTAKPFITADNQPVFKTKSGKIELYSKELEELGFEPIPTYEKNEEPPQGFYRLLYGRSAVHTFSRSVNNPALNELYKENELWLNSVQAKKLGLSDGQYVALQNQEGITSNRVRLKVTERIREDCVYMVHGFGQQSKGLTKAFRRGADDQQLISSYPVDPICGGTGMRCTFVKLVKGA